MLYLINVKSQSYSLLPKLNYEVIVIIVHFKTLFIFNSILLYKTVFSKLFKLFKIICL